ncbi:MAG TPA: cbb3-type cytochrome c oxidase subunit I, partial [Longimicrobiales bacterium]
EVYILILPAFGIVSEVLPTFARKPLFGAPVVIYSGVLIGFFGFGVWSHHMFAAGMGPVADAAFAIATMLIAIPTGVKIFNWLATLWGGTIRFTTPLLFVIGFLVLFTLGGISGVHHGSPPADLQQTDTYYVVAHFHYVLFGGLIMGVFSGFYFWFPKLTGRFMDETLGKWNFWLFFIGMNLTFFPMHFAGLLGMPRRIFTYSADLNLGTINMIETIGGYLTGVGMLVFLWNVLRSRKHGEPAGPNPWDAHTLEWATTSPPAEYNFANIPVVHSREPMWEDPERVATEARGEPAGPIHMPSGSYWPMFTAVGIVLAPALLMTELWWPPLIGLAWIAIGVLNWAYEPAH